MHYVHNDLLSLLGFYRYPHRILFIVGLPKSGTTWLRNQLALIPGYNVRIIYDPSGRTIYHDIADETFAALPSWGHSILKTHTRYTTENYRVITRHVARFVVLVRDLRDVAVSRYFHVLSDERHRHHHLYSSSTAAEGLEHSIRIVGEEYANWVRGWTSVAPAARDRVLLVRYEELYGDPRSMFDRVASFFGIRLSETTLAAMTSSRLRGERDLRRELGSKASLRLSSTARKGVVGDWRAHYQTWHKDLFKSLTGDLLVQLGYERDAEW